MIIEQIYTKCLAQGAYYVESNGEAFLIDPLRETAPYLKLLNERGTKLKYIFETHFHADFVSGHIDLANKTGATIVYGPEAETDYNIYSAKDEEVFQIGAIQIKILHTPGHTMESSSFLLIDEAGAEQAIFTGDTLFIGDVGRPDLAIQSNVTKEDLAALLFDSLRERIMPLPNHITVYPAHGAGSACGKNMSKETSDTLGNQKKTNYALRADMTKEEFVTEVLDGLGEPPKYFALNARMNKMGYTDIDTIYEDNLQGLSLEAFQSAMQEENILLLDTRPATIFSQGFVPNSINIGLNGDFAPWVGALIEDWERPILLITEVGKEKETVTRLARVGYHNILGYLEGGVETWTTANQSLDTIQNITADEFQRQSAQQSIQILDVRKSSEYNSHHITGAQNYPLSEIHEQASQQLNKDNTYYIHCAGGYRSMIFASILATRGFKNLVNVSGGFKAIQDTTIPLTDFVCPTTLK